MCVCVCMERPRPGSALISSPTFTCTHTTQLAPPPLFRHRARKANLFRIRSVGMPRRRSLTAACETQAQVRQFGGCSVTKPAEVSACHALVTVRVVHTFKTTCVKQTHITKRSLLCSFSHVKLSVSDVVWLGSLVNYAIPSSTIILATLKYDPVLKLLKVQVKLPCSVY